MSASKSYYQDTEQKKIQVYLGDGSEAMLYYGTVLVYYTNPQTSIFEENGLPKRHSSPQQFLFDHSGLCSKSVTSSASTTFKLSSKTTTAANSSPLLQSLGEVNDHADGNGKINSNNKIATALTNGSADSSNPFYTASNALMKNSKRSDVDEAASAVKEVEVCSPKGATGNFKDPSKPENSSTKNTNSVVFVVGETGASKCPFSPTKNTQSRRTIRRSRRSSQTNVSPKCSNTKERKQQHNFEVGRPPGLYGICDDDIDVSLNKIEEAKVRRTLLDARSRCYQILRSIRQTLLANLESFTTQRNECDKMKEVGPDEVASILLLLESFLKCLDVQAGLNRSLSVLLDNNSQECDKDTEEGSKTPIKEDKDDLLVECRSLMNQTTFSRSLVCTHLTNPFSSDLRYSCGEDRLYCVADEKAGGIYLPNGEGTLCSLSGKQIYRGQWKNGKRWGSGKAFILSGSEKNASPKHFGMYEGSWWNNMRHGEGRMVFASSGEYNGEWQYDMICGIGTMTYPDGSSFEGAWDENEPDGCGVFTLTNGDIECREYNKGEIRRVVRMKGKGRQSSPFNDSLRDYAILRIKFQSLFEEKTHLLQVNSNLRDTIEQQNNQISTVEGRLNDHEEKLQRAKEDTRKRFLAKKLDFERKHNEKLKEVKDSHENKIKELEDKIGKVKAELEANKAAVVCQICFDRSRDCILMPCTHMLYCRECISKDRKEGRNRCPACQGAISGEITCNISK